MVNVAAQAAFDSAKFRSILLSIRLQSLLQDLPDLALNVEPTSVDWNYALLCASALTAENSEEAQIAVLRVASGCLSDQTTSVQQRIAALALLERDGNDPAVLLAQRNGLVPEDPFPSLPIALRLEVAKSKVEHSVRLSTGHVFPVNSFQGELWKRASQFSWLSISAPTSSGKSRILREWFLEKLRTNARYSAVYLVPTRALVEEVAAGFRKSTGTITSVFVMPWDTSVHEAPNRVLVLTQERLHLIQTADPAFHIDLLFVDEAHGLGGAHRGILLQQVIDRAVDAHPQTQVILASPLSSNPELLLEGKPDLATSSSFGSETVTVNQNLLRVEPAIRNRKRRLVSLVHGGEAHEIGDITFDVVPGGVFKTIAAIAHKLGKTNGGNLVYANRPTDAEHIAQAIYDLENVLPDSDDPEILDLQSLIKSSVHPNYDLIRVLGRGIGFHYGNMPLAIRSEIERLFEHEKINYLVCTSTLLEGVNLPCKNIFIRAPRKGTGNPMSALDFWNLAGRAGRWGKEFQGNVICIDTTDPEGWPEVPAVRGRFPLERAVPSGLRNPAALLDYISSAHELSGANSDGENLFSYLAARLISGSDLSQELSNIADSDVRQFVLNQITNSVVDGGIPTSLIPEHAGISPIAMTRLLNNFRESGLSPKQLALPNPKANLAKARYQAAYVRLGLTVTSAFGRNHPQADDDKRKWQIAGLVVNWMKGFPLRSLIEQRVSASAPLPKAIRDVMSDIETVVRFQSAKYLACYTDVLNVYAREIGESEIAPDFDVTMMLELGVSEPTQVALMAAGLSRTATLAITPFIESTSWTPLEAMNWLRSIELDSLKIAGALKREIAHLVQTSSDTSV